MMHDRDSLYRGEVLGMDIRASKTVVVWPDEAYIKYRITTSSYLNRDRSYPTRGSDAVGLTMTKLDIKILAFTEIAEKIDLNAPAKPSIEDNPYASNSDVFFYPHATNTTYRDRRWRTYDRHRDRDRDTWRRSPSPPRFDTRARSRSRSPRRLDSDEDLALTPTYARQPIVDPSVPSVPTLRTCCENLLIKSINLDTIGVLLERGYAHSTVLGAKCLSFLYENHALFTQSEENKNKDWPGLQQISPEFRSKLKEYSKNHVRLIRGGKVVRANGDAYEDITVVVPFEKYEFTQFCDFQGTIECARRKEEATAKVVCVIDTLLFHQFSPYEESSERWRGYYSETDSLKNCVKYMCNLPPELYNPMDILPELKAKLKAQATEHATQLGMKVYEIKYSLIPKPEEDKERDYFSSRHSRSFLPRRLKSNVFNANEYSIILAAYFEARAELPLEDRQSYTNNPYKKHKHNNHALPQEHHSKAPHSNRPRGRKKYVYRQKVTQNQQLT